MWFGKYLTIAHVSHRKYKSQSKANKTHNSIQCAIYCLSTFLSSGIKLSLVKWLVSFYTNMHRLEFKKKPVHSYHFPSQKLK